MGKGSAQRPTNAQAFGANYDAIFGKVERKTYGQTMGSDDGVNWQPAELPPEIAAQIDGRASLVNQLIVKAARKAKA